MSDRIIRPVEPYRPDEAYDPGQQLETRQPKVLWGRVIALSTALLAAFLLGRGTSGDGLPEERLDRLRAELARVKDQNARLRQEAQRATAPVAPATTVPPPETEDAPAPQPQRTYVVRRGDTLASIARRFYGDVSLARVIARVNGITSPNLVVEGQTLLIPRNPRR